MFICARGENFNFAKDIGVGLVESAIELTAIILRENPKFLIFIGSAGAYSKDIKLLDIFVSNSATQIESSFSKGESYTPLENKIEMVSYETLGESNGKSKNLGANLATILDSRPRAIVNSSNYICTDEIFAHKMTNTGILLENMEFFAILKVADYFKIPALGIFCITNHCDKDAHKNFIALHKDAHKKLSMFALEVASDLVGGI
ncbi:5'-methylthioadenosine/S-adenosylhomocysteine nucleosidase family protein [Helicobacter sp. 23-1048]